MWLLELFADNLLGRRRDSSLALYQPLFLKYGANPIWIAVDESRISNNSNPVVVAQVESCSGFFFGGGDQSRVVVSSPAL